MTDSREKSGPLGSENMRALQSAMVTWTQHQRVPPQDAEDLLQEVLLALRSSSALTRFQDQRDLIRYALGILRRKWALLIRRRILEARARSQVRGLEPTERHPLDALADLERRQRMQAVIASLPAMTQRVLFLRNCGWTFEKIAEDMGKEPATLRKLYWRALEEVRQALLA